MHSFVYLIAGAALMNIVGVYKEIQDQHMNIVRSLFNLRIDLAQFRSAFNEWKWALNILPILFRIKRIRTSDFNFNFFISFFFLLTRT